MDDQSIHPDISKDYIAQSDIHPSGQAHIQQSSHIHWNIAIDNKDDPEISFNEKYQHNALANRIAQTLRRISDIPHPLSHATSSQPKLSTHFSPISSYNPDDIAVNDDSDDEEEVSAEVEQSTDAAATAGTAEDDEVEEEEDEDHRTQEEEDEDARAKIEAIADDRVPDSKEDDEVQSEVLDDDALEPPPSPPTRSYLPPVPQPHHPIIPSILLCLHHPILSFLMIMKNTLSQLHKMMTLEC